MMRKAWSSIEEVPCCFSRSSVKFQGHIALKIVKFDPNWAFPDCNSSLNSPMAIKCCTKLETAKKRCPIFLQGDPSNFKVTRDKTSLILTQIGRFRTIGRSQLSNPSDLPCFIRAKIYNWKMGWMTVIVTYHFASWPHFFAKTVRNSFMRNLCNFLEPWHLLDEYCCDYVDETAFDVADALYAWDEVEGVDFCCIYHVVGS